MISERSGRIGTLLPYTPLPTPAEFIRSEYEKAEEEEIARCLRSSLSSFVSTKVSCGTDSSIIHLVGSLSSSSQFLSREAESPSSYFGHSRLDSQDFVLDSSLEKISFEVDQLCKLYENVVNTQRQSLKTWQQLGTIEEEVFRLFDERRRKIVGTVVWQNCWNEVSSERDRIWELFCESTQAILDIRAQLTKVIKITESFLDHYKQ